MRRLTVLLAIAACALSAQTKKILVMGAGPDVKEYQSASPKANVIAVTRENVMQEIGDADGFIGTITPEMVRAGKKLRWTQIMSAGVENVLYKSGPDATPNREFGAALRDSPIVLTNNQIVQGPEIADHALAMLLYLTRRLYDPAWTSPGRSPGQYPGIELRGRTAVVIGVGGIGTQISFRAWAFGMNVIGVDPEDIPFMPVIQRVVKPDQLNEVLPLADVVFISAPHTPMSHKMMGPAQFELMKKGSYFIAVSRGGIYDLPSLVKGLDSQKLAGAGVDVTDPEPLPKDNALWKFKNAVITPHIAGRSDKDHARMVGTIKDNIKRFAEDMPLINVVDKQKGY
jgi:phosphoglycerate dehydrogenase-like enzyme